MSDLLNQASLVYIPSGYKEDTAYSVIPTDGSGDLTFTRASDGTRVNSAGLVENVPWNLALQSEDFSNAAWIKQYSTITANDTTAPNGTATADKILATATNSDHGIYNTTPYSSNFVGEVYTYSVYAKKGTVDWLVLDHFQGSYTFTWFNLNTGTLGTVGSGVTATIESVGNGWYRCICTKAITATTTNYIGIYLSNANNIQNFNAVGTESIYIWGAQVNQGTLKPYFPTTDRQNVPRLTYEGGCPSLLLEPQRTNLFTYSEQFDNAAWTKSLCTITANQIVSPSGYLDADLVTTSGTSDSLQQSVSVTSGTTYTFSAFVKNDSAGTIGLVVFSSFPTSVGTYNLTNGTATSGTGSPVVSIQNYGNGWYRATLTATATSTGTANFYFSSTSPDAVSTYYIWGAQLEAGAYPTSYIPTTSASVTRLADAAYKTGISSLIGQTEGTIFADITRITSTANDAFWISISDGTTNDWLFMGTEATGGRFYVRVSNSVKVDEYPSFSIGRHKLALGYKSGEVVGYMDGVQLFTSTNTFSITSLTKISIGPSSASSNPVNTPGEVNQAALFKTRLTNAELAALTTL